MIGRLLVFVLVAASFGVATTRLPVVPCMVASTPDSKACQAGSCANKVCCETSSHRASVPSQPLVKSGVSYDFSAVTLLAVACPLPVEIPATPQASLSTATLTLPPPARVLLCTFLI